MKQDFTEATKLFKSIVPGIGASNRANTMLIQSYPEENSKDRINFTRKYDDGSGFSFIEFNHFYPR